ncbi:hypothetical protein ACJX0J_033220 [Zea mays]
MGAVRLDSSLILHSFKNKIMYSRIFMFLIKVFFVFAQAGRYEVDGENVGHIRTFAQQVMNFCDSVLDLGGCIKAPILNIFLSILVPQTKHFGIYKVYNGIMLSILLFDDILHPKKTCTMR